MRRFLQYVAFLMVTVCFICTVSASSADSVTVATAKEFLENLTKDALFKKGTVLLDSDIILSYPQVLLLITSLTIDGQGHALGFSSEYAAPWDGITISMPNKGYLKFQNIPDLGSLNILYGYKGTVLLENATLTGDAYTFNCDQATLSSVRASRVYAKGRKRVASISGLETKLVLDQNCELDQDWMVSTTNGDIVVDCDYYDAEVEAFANGSASFSGKGTGRGTLSVVMRAKGKINVDAQTEKLKVVFSDPESTENQTITVKGSAHDVIIEAIGAQLNKQKLNMQLSDVNQVRFEVSLDVGKIAQPTTEEEEEQLRDMVRKSMKNISLKKVKDSSGTPVQEVTYKVSGSDGPGIIPWKLEWTEAWSGK